MELGLFDSLAEKVLLPEEIEGFRAELAAFTEGEGEKVLLELKRVMALVEALALKSLAASQPATYLRPPPQEVLEKSFGRALRLLSAFQSCAETMRRYRNALPEGGTTINQLVLQATPERVPDAEEVVSCEVLEEKLGLERQ